MSPAGSFTVCAPYTSSITSSPPSYASGSDRKSVAETSVRMRCAVPGIWRMALSTWAPKAMPSA